MAWRIHTHLIHGEIDNREPGVVRGKLWLAGQTGPVVLELRGNAAPDLAGCLLTFENPGEKIPLRSDHLLALRQSGTVGELTASRKIRISDRPEFRREQPGNSGPPPPERLANALYLEWFSEANGRVVLESADFLVRISPPAWRLSPDEERQGREQAAANFDGFMHKLDDALAAQAQLPPDDKEWDEFDYERFLRECDARTDKYAELMDKYLDHPDRDRIVAREMGWKWLEEASDSGVLPASSSAAETPPAEPDGPEAAAREDQQDFLQAAEDESLPEPDPATEGVDWVRKPDGYVGHPLALRALDGSLAFWDRLEDLALADTRDENLRDLLDQYHTLAAKLAGALDGLAYGRDLCEGAFIVACLKRALTHLHAAQAALERVVSRRLLPDKILAQVKSDLFFIREEVLRLMEEFRGRTGA